MGLKIEHDVLVDVINLRKRYALVDKLIARPFNIFSILRAERNERFTHSAFIAELLNPKGSHCQGDIFLKLLLNGIKWPDDFPIDISKSIVKTEQFTGDGFIDIWIDFGDAYICIENKIDAGDQPDQLHRYNQHCLKLTKPYKLIYLTLDGHTSENGKNDFEYEKWSYQAQVIPWLDQCIKESAKVQPALRETIYQYRQLIKKLCGMLQNENEAKELNELLKKDLAHFEAANNIHEQYKRTKYEVKYDFWSEVKQNFEERYNEDLMVEYSFSESDNYPHVIIGHKNVDEWYACFCIEWLQRNPYYGICSCGYRNRSANEKKIIDSYEELYIKGFRDSESWFAYKYYDHIDFSSIETLSQTFSPAEKQNLILQIVEPVDRLIEEFGERVLEINNEISAKLNK